MTLPLPTGTHMLVDYHGCRHLDDPAPIERALIAAAEAARATLLDIRLHHFGPEGGVTGVALLAESHISIHTWPEHEYAAVDIFLCGETHDPQAACAVIETALGANRQEVTVFRRGHGAGVALMR